MIDIQSRISPINGYKSIYMQKPYGAHRIEIITNDVFPAYPVAILAGGTAEEQTTCHIANLTFER